MKNSGGKFNASLHLKAQVDQLIGRNDELRRELRTSREEAASALSQLGKAKEKVIQHLCEINSWWNGDRAACLVYLFTTRTVGLCPTPRPLCGQFCVLSVLPWSSLMICALGFCCFGVSGDTVPTLILLVLLRWVVWSRNLTA